MLYAIILLSPFSVPYGLRVMYQLQAEFVADVLVTIFFLF